MFSTFRGRLSKQLGKFRHSLLVERLDRIRLQLAGLSPGLALPALGLLSGIAAGLVIIVFRLTVESSQAAFLPLGGTENYEELSLAWRLLLPSLGGVLIAATLVLLARGPMRLGVVHVMERLAFFEGHLPFRNACAQFIGGALALITGQSVGREGPSIHLGAAAASLLGQNLSLPNNSIRTLVACGAAAAIAASFNTPLAGVVFAMEVVMMEYTIATFTPVILAAVAATTLNRLVFGSSPAFLVPQLDLANLWELGCIVLMGVLIGILAAGLIRTVRWITHLGKEFQLWERIIVAGVGVGFCAMVVPEVMGIGYDTVDATLVGDFGWTTLCAIVAFKLFATALCVGLNMPAGLIGPTLVIGASAGASIGVLVNLMPTQTSHSGLYAMLGMGAMMGATLQAPLAALLALLELTANPNIILPGMLAIVSANLAARNLFNSDSVFLSQMRELGLDYANDPVAQSLRRQGVAYVMSRSFRTTAPLVERDAAEALLGELPQWIIIEQDTTKLLLPARQLAHYLETDTDPQIDLLAIPGNRRQMSIIHPQATLQEALTTLQKDDSEALFVARPIAPMTFRIFGVVLRQDIEGAYQIRTKG